VSPKERAFLPQNYSATEAFLGKAGYSGVLVTAMTARHKECEMREEWTAQLPSGTKVRYTYTEMTTTMASITAQVEGDAVLHMLNNVPAPLTRQQVQDFFADKLAMQ